jgi:hypothetical protein
MADETVARALGVLRQGAIGRDHAIPLTDDETAWLGADARGRCPALLGDACRQ